MANNYLLLYSRSNYHEKDRISDKANTVLFILIDEVNRIDLQKETNRARRVQRAFENEGSEIFQAWDASCFNFLSRRERRRINRSTYEVSSKLDSVRPKCVARRTLEERGEVERLQASPMTSTKECLNLVAIANIEPE